MKVDSKTPKDPWSFGDSRQQVMKVYSRQKVMKVDSKTPQDPWSWGDSRQQVMKVYRRQKVREVESKTPQDPWSWGGSKQQVMKVTADKKMTAKLYLKMVIIVIHKPLFQWSWGVCLSVVLFLNLMADKK